MKKIVCILFLGTMLACVSAQPARCEVTAVAGVAVDEFGLSVDIDPVSPLANAPNSLDFSPPCWFAHAIPAAKEPYKHLGFSFKGNGAVLNECGGFGVTGYSPPNFLAFNCNSLTANGKVPSLPEKITFKPPVRSVSFRIGSGISAGETVQVTVNKKTYTSTITLADNMPQYTFSTPDPIIKTLNFTVPVGSNACVVVIDDIQVTP